MNEWTLNEHPNPICNALKMKILYAKEETGEEDEKRNNFEEKQVQ